MKGRAKSAGFTLIELLIVVVIVGILVAVAVPAYNDQVRKTRRADGKAAALQMVQALERWHTVNNTYAGYSTTMTSPAGSATPSYNIAASNLSAVAYTVTATPQGAQVADRCGTMTVNQTGARTESGPATLAECWQQ